MLNRLRREQQGAVMVVAAFSLTVLLLFCGLALDFGRAHLMRARLQTAVDAAALSGALQVSPMVDLAIYRWREVRDVCIDPMTKEKYTCYSWESASDARVSGRRFDLVSQGGWRSAVATQCGGSYRCADTYRVVREWLVLPGTTVPTAESTFRRNATWPGGPDGARVTGLNVAVNPDKVEVTATASMAMPTSFLKLVGIPELSFIRTGSAVPVRR